MSDEAKKDEKTNGPGKPQPLVIHIEAHPNGEFMISGPVNEPMLFLGLLEVAKARLVSKLTQAEIVEAAESEARKPRIVTPNGMRFQ